MTNNVDDDNDNNNNANKEDNDEDDKDDDNDNNNDDNNDDNNDNQAIFHANGAGGYCLSGTIQNALGNKPTPPMLL